MRLLHIIHSIAQICMDGIIFIKDLLCLANEAVSLNPRPAQAGTHPYIIFHASLREN